MKKYVIAICCFAAVTACNSNNSASEKKDSTAATATAAPANGLSANPDYQKGLELVAKSDCLTCHKIKEKLTGPAYQDVANKYESTDANIEMLAKKVIKGGSGVWGAIPMTPHATLSEDDAKQMVKYILLLKK